MRNKLIILLCFLLPSCFESKPLPIPDDLYQMFPYEIGDKIGFASNNNDTLILKINDISFEADAGDAGTKNTVFTVYIHFSSQFDIDVRTPNINSEKFNKNEGICFDSYIDAPIFQRNQLFDYDIIFMKNNSSIFYESHGNFSKFNIGDTILNINNVCWNEYYKKGVGLYKMQNKEGVVWTLIE